MDPVKQNMGSRRVIHGGGCHNEAQFCRAAHRFSDDPTFRSFSYGLRLALSSPSIKSPEAEQGAEPVGAGTEGARR